MSWTDLTLLGGAIVVATIGKPVVDYLYDRYKQKNIHGQASFTTIDILDRHAQNPLIAFIESKTGIKVVQPEDLITPSDTKYLLTNYVCLVDLYHLQYRTPNTQTWVSIPHTGPLLPMIVVVDEFYNARTYDGTQSSSALKKVFPYVIDLRKLRRDLEDIKMKSDINYKVNKLYDE
jgi:hypothetical protein